MIHINGKGFRSKEQIYHCSAYISACSSEAAADHYISFTLVSAAIFETLISFNRNKLLFGSCTFNTTTYEEVGEVIEGTFTGVLDPYPHGKDS